MRGNRSGMRKRCRRTDRSRRTNQTLQESGRLERPVEHITLAQALWSITVGLAVALGLLRAVGFY